MIRDLLAALVWGLTSSAIALCWLSAAEDGCIGDLALIIGITLSNLATWILCELAWDLIRAGIAALDVADGRAGRVDPRREDYRND